MEESTRRLKPGPPDVRIKDMNRLLRWLPDGHPALETGVATLAGFLAGLALRDEWQRVEWLWRVLFGG